MQLTVIRLLTSSNELFSSVTFKCVVDILFLVLLPFIVIYVLVLYNIILGCILSVSDDIVLLV